MHGNYSNPMTLRFKLLGLGRGWGIGAGGGRASGGRLWLTSHDTSAESEQAVAEWP